MHKLRVGYKIYNLRRKLKLRYYLQIHIGDVAMVVQIGIIDLYSKIINYMMQIKFIH